MRAVLDACVLYPTATRSLLLVAAGGGHFVPVWSERILEEWARAMARDGAAAEAATRGVIAALEARWQASVVPDAVSPDLPDPNDTHVLGACLAGGAGVLVTRNLRDFPRRRLAGHGVMPSDPDSFLLGFARSGADFASAAEDMRVQAGWTDDLRSFLKRAGLPRLGKFLAAA
ncbi:PIN domain-containing protein [Paroceanicella profunda]|uniref:PIN domain-containing protein n=1 Tax=Paroceanicella profunda TaxID=2579971 RepID=A0A5B8FI05_9RHOB|nr:PIN domain-containing protein [Paroceanicella profunda]QDL93101.1 PIN domain-containing protein [Paroceanicella profunda]